jgi:Ca2+-binding RTX toxin-like protein
MTRFARTALALGVVVLIAASLWAWPAAGGQGTSFYVDCTFSPANGVLQVRINDEEGLVRRRGDQIQVLAPTGGGPSSYEVIDCGGTATVNNTDLIRMRIDSVADAITSGVLSLRGGPFAPGRTPESGVPEIEILTSAHNDYEELRVEGTSGDDRFRAGRLDGSRWVNLNPDAEGVSPDADVQLPSAGRATAGFDMGRGDDTVTVNGGPEFDGPLGAKVLFLTLGRGADYYRARHSSSLIFAGRGADTVVGGRHLDFVFGNLGDDSIRTQGGSDAVIAVGGSDRVWTGKGRDLVFAKDGRRDRVSCGPGLDHALFDARDRARSCERELDLGESALNARSPYSALRLRGPTRR